MKKQRFTLQVIIIGLLILLIATCVKEDINQSLVCLITAPADGDEIGIGDTVIISVEATDSAGSITVVNLWIDDSINGSDGLDPYMFTWITTNDSLGIHTMRAICINNNGDSASSEISVTLADLSPIAGFSASPTSGTAPLIVDFTDQSTNNPTHYQWDFGDGNASTQQNPSHTYNYGDKFTVTLNVSNSYDSSWATQDIAVADNMGTFTDTRDNQTYNTIVIGNQTWFAENLNYETDVSMCYNFHPTNCQIYGRLYDGHMAKFACPNGWHLPDDEEWKTLEIALGMSQSDADSTDWRGTNVGEKMKSTSGWNSNGNGTNSSGFNALAGGYRGMVGSYFYNLGNYGQWWSSTPSYGQNIWTRGLYFGSDQVFRLSQNTAFRYSVRCLED